MTKAVRVGLTGTGFIARGVWAHISTATDLSVTRILTRRALGLNDTKFPPDIMTNSINDLLDHCDVVLECSGDTQHAAEVMMRAGRAGRPIVTMNSEAQITVGTALLREGFRMTEAHGDQPGCLAELDRTSREYGFDPLVYVNLKGFLNFNPSREEMEYWGPKQGLSLRSVTAFTDGSKLQIEQVLVANGLGARIARPGMIGGTVQDLADTDHLVRAAQALSSPISDFVLNPGGPPGVLILASNDLADACTDYMPFTRLKTREGLAYRMLVPHHLVFLEIIRTLRETIAHRPPLLTNSLNPTATAAVTPKRTLPSGYHVAEALGGFDVRGVAVEIRDYPKAVPITLADGMRLRRAVEPGEILSWDDVELEETTALQLYRSSLEPLN